MAKLQPGQRKVCDGPNCTVQLVGALTINGKTAPVEVAASDEGNVWLGRNKAGQVVCAQLAGPLLTKAREVGIALHHNHYATCVDKDRFRGGR